jgi:hypothetical protein
MVALRISEASVKVLSHCSVDWEYWLVPEFAGTPDNSEDMSMKEFMLCKYTSFCSLWSMENHNLFVYHRPRLNAVGGVAAH